MVLLDVDGVMTDGRIMYGDDGTEYKSFHAHDGYGIERALRLGLRIGFVSGRKSTIVERRARELGIVDLYQNFMDKISALEDLKRKYNFADEHFAFMGDDAFDLPLLEKVGFSAAPQDAVDDVKKNVDYVAQHKGGRGAVRELLDMILSAQKKA
jgi:3-deoxy-D-manno-octulosonate 8-phosphate phosphatase (KDO 8-P phosphatase)